MSERLAFQQVAALTSPDDSYRDRRRTASAIGDAVGWLENEQAPDGFWAGILESNCCMEAEWLLAFHVLGYSHPQTQRIIQGILDRQRSDGAWEVYFDAPTGDINATVECYVALRAYGVSPEAAPMQRACRWILDHGGIPRTRVFTRYWLALIGEWPWVRLPNLPPEIIRFPRWFVFNLYNFASWARATLVPLCILSARQHVVPLPENRRPRELQLHGRQHSSETRTTRVFSWRRFFLVTDRLLHVIQRLRLTPGRRAAIQRCVEWILRHQDADGAWGGIQPPWIYSVMALHSAGYALSHPAMAAGLGALDTHWSYERAGSLRIQASESPVWDTALSLLALLDAGIRLGESVCMQKALRWLLDQEVRVPGDWCVKVREVPPGGGWAFERANLHYPDVDDTAVVLLLLVRCRQQTPDFPGLSAAIGRAVDWLLAMQCRNGGWAAFDRDNDREILTRIPFCDFGETLDPPSVDVTAHVLEALGALGHDCGHPAVARGLAFIRSQQEPGGSWFGRWGVNHIYGTAAVLPALRAIGADMRADYVRRAADWLAGQQTPGGGWGESCASYMDPAWIGRGHPTASQTAWALIGLLAVSRESDQEAIALGVQFLVGAQANGTWDEPYYTGTGFPGYGVGARTEIRDGTLGESLGQGSELQRGFMINYNLYRHYFPLAALGRAAAAGF